MGDRPRRNTPPDVRLSGSQAVRCEGCGRKGQVNRKLIPKGRKTVKDCSECRR